MLTFIEKTDWKEICEPVWLCMLPLTAPDLIAMYPLSFEAVEEPGTGSVWYAYGQIGEVPVMFKTYSMDAADKQYLSVYILGQETQWDAIVDQLCAACAISEDDLLHRESMLVPGQWLLTRLDDNNNEVEMLRFPDDFRASQAQEEYERRGHKQTYRVRAAN